MINKNELQNTIGKYHLNGLIESVKWSIADNALTIDFQSPLKDMIGRLNHTSFPLTDAEVAIYDTSKLNKLLSITSGEVFINLTKPDHAKIYDKLIISDATYTLNYTLSELLLIQKVGTVDDPDNYKIITQLDSESITALIKAHNALESDNVIVSIDRDLDGEDVLLMSFGDDLKHTNKIDYQIPYTTLKDIKYGTRIPFDSKIIKNILNNNKDAIKATMKINSGGLMKFEFEGENWNSYYYVVRKANI
ncbi:MAG: hypothetical protein HOG33_06230 [Candidatus Marinimicrobia bacterium]|nr:hypothetical protein [Candidatus Neomarinimicrobiota bacterium]